MVQFASTQRVSKTNVNVTLPLRPATRYHQTAVNLNVRLKCCINLSSVACILHAHPSCPRILHAHPSCPLCHRSAVW